MLEYETLKNDEIFYYIMFDPDKNNRCKVGITKNVQQRLRAYRTACPQCTFYDIWILQHKKHELMILDIIKDVFTVDREYVHCNPKIIKNIIDSYITDLDVF